MILPNGNSKKYIKTIIGIYILYAIISPVITISTGNEIKLDYSEYEKYFGNVYEYRDLEENSNIETYNLIEDTYKEEIKKQLKSDIEKLGFSVSNINYNLDFENGKITKIDIIAQKKETLSDVNSIIIEKIEISNTKMKSNDLSRQEIMQIKEMIQDNYGVDVDEILINSI